MPFINKQYLFTYLALVRRDCIVIRQQLRSALIDTTIRLFTEVLTFGALFPAMGVPHNLIAPLFVGAVTLQLLFFGMGFGIKILFDVKFNRFIDYRLTLPLPKRWLFAASITYFCLEALIVTLPLFTIGVILLGGAFAQMAPHWILFFVTYLLMLCLYGLLFLGLSLYYTFDWFMQNLWPRRLTFLLMMSPLFFVWYKAFEFSPWLARLMLLSPLTYTAEGLRATLIGGSEYIRPSFCIPMILVWIVLFTWFAASGIKKRLDPV